MFGRGLYCRCLVEGSTDYVPDKHPGYEGIFGVQGYIRGTRVYPGYEGISGVRGYIRGTMVYREYEGISGARGYIRGTRVYLGYEGISGVRGYIRGTRVYLGYEDIFGVVRGGIQGTRNLHLNKIKCMFTRTGVGSCGLPHWVSDVIVADIWELEVVLLQITHYIYIYIYICECVCICIFFIC